jgi:hypothetical protein
MRNPASRANQGTVTVVAPDMLAKVMVMVTNPGLQTNGRLCLRISY